MSAIISCAFKFVIVLLITDHYLVDLSVFAQESSCVAESFRSHQIVPDVVPVPPFTLVYVKYPSGVIVNLGNELNVTDVVLKPSASWDAAADRWYTLAMVDPDVPSRKLPIAGELRHWLVVNIPGDKVDEGNTLSKYLSPTPPPGSGLHRYTFLVYMQSAKFTSDKLGFIKNQILRTNFNITEFAEQHNLGNPIAGNFFQAKIL